MTRTDGQASPADRRRRRRAALDRIVGGLVRAGGLGVVASVLAILVFIVLQVLPLGRPARVTPGPVWRDVAVASRAPLVDDRLEVLVQSAPDGVARMVDLSNGSISAPLGEPARVVRAIQSVPHDAAFLYLLADGTVEYRPIGWAVSLVGDTHRVRPRTRPPLRFAPGGVDMPAPRIAAVQVTPEGRALAAAQLEDGSVRLLAPADDEGAPPLQVGAPAAPWAPPLQALWIDEDQATAYGLSADRGLLWWGIRGQQLVPRPPPATGDSPVRAISLLLGGRGIVLGRADGSIEVWLPCDSPGALPELRRVRSLPPLNSPVRALASSPRDRSFAALGDGGEVALYHSTSGRRLWHGRAPLPEPTALRIAPRGDALVFAGGGDLGLLEVDPGHPAISWRTLFGRVWYEGRDRPERVWQSSGGSDLFEPKLSLAPLIFGTIKGTVFSLLLALPLAILGAIYTSQFMAPRLRRVVQPLIEIMAAFPSVVLGLIALLWLAPRVGDALVPAVVLALLLPPLMITAGLTCAMLPPALRARLPDGSEILAQLVALVVGAGLALILGAAIERTWLDGDARVWLGEQTGWVFDQQNALIVGLAMGFAVIPIIFSITEEALSGVPRDLVSGSLSLGAGHWQTIARIILPTAAPGIFAAAMIGFGRAVGETMIVVMATGNTPIMDWSPFNGFRTLSATIAVEIPEAPFGGTLYRTLFLTALLLFVFTFVINTIAEVVRGRLRERCARL